MNSLELIRILEQKIWTKPIKGNIVNILGFFWWEFPYRKIKTQDDIHGDIWTLNDFYTYLPWLDKVNLLFEMHPLEAILNSPDRYKNYNKTIERAEAIIIVDRFLELYLQENVIFLDYKSLHEKYPELEFSSTIDYMIMKAVEQYDIINLMGIHLQSSEHIIYCRSLIKTIDKVRELGKVVLFDWYDECKEIAKDQEKQPKYINILYKEKP